MGLDGDAATASAPAKCILFGEHAVVYGEPAVAVALEQRLQVRIKPAKSWSIDGSSLVAKRHPHIHHLVHALWPTPRDPKPLSVHVSGDIPRASGLGSSAALSVALCAALDASRTSTGGLGNDEMSHLAHMAEATAQSGRASPMDTSTSTLGGVVVLSDKKEDGCEWVFTRELETPEGKRTWEIHTMTPPRDEVYLVLGNTGVHAPTSHQVALVAAALQANPSRINEIRAVGSIARRGLKALQEGDYEAVGHAMSENHIILRNLGVSSDELETLISAALPSSLGAKLTGAGGGGCMVALTRNPKATSEAIELAGGRTLISRLGNPGVTLIKGPKDTFWHE
ncbi:MAG: mevalonate kinase [Candidatus Poseidonia sp.]|uniref:mevalonate kinase n=1 Tax=Poseidonia sp. TaxID=2666344 RepID=UPI0030BD0861|nr:mevalonate kinase [Poseidonia sp.]